MAQELLPFKYLGVEGFGDGQTALAGLGTYLELAQVLGLPAAIERHVKLREGTQGYTDRQMVMALLFLQLAGGLKAPGAEFDASAYKFRAIVTNLLDWDGDRVIRWHRERCGRSEQVHDVLKNELAGGTMPSKLFGVNAAWWLITVLAHNLNQAMKMLALTKVDRSWAERRLKAVRFHLIHLPGRVTQHAREMVVRVSTVAARFLAQVRGQILELIRAAPA